MDYTMYGSSPLPIILVGLVHAVSFLEQTEEK